MHDSLTPLGGLVPLAQMMLNCVFGGDGVGLINLLQYAILTVFLAGMMIGRTPEFLGKKIEAREIKLVMLAVMAHPISILGFTALAAVWPDTMASLTNRGPHGFSEVLYAYASGTANNGSAFAGLNAEHAVLQHHHRPGHAGGPISDAAAHAGPGRQPGGQAHRACGAGHLPDGHAAVHGAAGLRGGRGRRADLSCLRWPWGPWSSSCRCCQDRSTPESLSQLSPFFSWPPVLPWQGRAAEVSRCKFKHILPAPCRCCALMRRPKRRPFQAGCARCSAPACGRRCSSPWSRAWPIRWSPRSWPRLRFPKTANGSLVMRQGSVVGSALIGQEFASPRYFQGRPSATTAPDPDKADATVAAPYNAALSAATNQGPTHAALKESVAARVAAYRRTQWSGGRCRCACGCRDGLGLRSGSAHLGGQCRAATAARGPRAPTARGQGPGTVASAGGAARAGPAGRAAR